MSSTEEALNRMLADARREGALAERERVKRLFDRHLAASELNDDRTAKRISSFIRDVTLGKGPDDA